MNGLLCFALPMIAATLYFAWLYWKERQSLERLAREGQTVAATIVERGSQFAGRGGMVYYVAYQFEVDKDANGAPILHNQREQVSTSLFKRLNEGDRVPICYLAGDLSTARLEGEYQDRSRATSNLVLCGFCAVLSILLLIAMLRGG